MLTLAVLVLIGGFVAYLLTPEERLGVLRTGLDVMRRAVDVVSRGRTEDRLFLAALHARTPWPVVAPAIVLLNVGIYLFRLVGDPGLGDPDTPVLWGASVGPRTTNGEWWRLVTALFVHPGLLSLLVTLGGFVQVGFLLERLVGSFSFAVIYLGTGALTNLVSLSTSPLDVRLGAQGAICGVYGLLAATSIWSLVRRSPVTIPLRVLKRLAPGMVLLVLYTLATDSAAPGAQSGGFIAGLGWGLLLARGVSDRTPPARRAAAAMVAIAVFLAAFAVPLRGLADAGPDLDQIVAVEDRTAAAYQEAVDQFRIGRTSTQALIQVVDDTVVPELQRARARLKQLGRIPEEQVPLVARVETYLRLRQDSWHLRVEGLRTASVDLLREADRLEFAALEFLGTVRVDGRQ